MENEEILSKEEKIKKIKKLKKLEKKLQRRLKKDKNFRESLRNQDLCQEKTAEEIENLLRNIHSKSYTKKYISKIYPDELTQKNVESPTKPITVSLFDNESKDKILIRIKDKVPLFDIFKRDLGKVKKKRLLKKRLLKSKHKKEKNKQNEKQIINVTRATKRKYTKRQNKINIQNNLNNLIHNSNNNSTSKINNNSFRIDKDKEKEKVKEFDSNDINKRKLDLSNSKPKASSKYLFNNPVLNTNSTNDINLNHTTITTNHINLINDLATNISSNIANNSSNNNLATTAFGSNKPKNPEMTYVYKTDEYPEDRTVSDLSESENLTSNAKLNKINSSDEKNSKANQIKIKGNLIINNYINIINSNSITDSNAPLSQFLNGLNSGENKFNINYVFQANKDKSKEKESIIENGSDKKTRKRKGNAKKMIENLNDNISPNNKDIELDEKANDKEKSPAAVKIAKRSKPPKLETSKPKQRRHIPDSEIIELKLTTRKRRKKEN